MGLLDDHGSTLKFAFFENFFFRLSSKFFINSQKKIVINKKTFFLRIKIQKKKTSLFKTDLFGHFDEKIILFLFRI